MMKVAAIGECMLELSHLTPQNMTAVNLGYGGDTLNTAVYMSRLGAQVAYLTALGSDPYSKWLIEQWQEEGIDTRLVVHAAKELPGIYAIELDSLGERQFHYWRQHSAARHYLRHVKLPDLLVQLRDFNLLYLSGITLSLYDEFQLKILYELCSALRKTGTKVAFDSNFRPAAWPSLSMAREVFSHFATVTDIALPTFEDEQALFGDQDTSTTISRLIAKGIKEIVLKSGKNGCTLMVNEAYAHVPIPKKVPVVDTTAAGDSFNAAYLMSRLNGQTPEESALSGHQLAAKVIQCKGAIINSQQQFLGIS